jgi:flagellar basal-body rod protein FlgC
MSDILGIALSGAAAATKRIDATASNLANQRTTGRLPDAKGADAKGAAGTDSRAPYTPLTTSQSDLRTANGQGAGTTAALKPLSQPFVAEYDPSSSDANAEGMVGAPNVDTDQQIGQQILGSRAYSANLSMVRTSSDMMKDLLDMKA